MVNEAHINILNQNIASLNKFIENQQIYNPIIAQLELAPIKEIEEMARIHIMKLKKDMQDEIKKKFRGLLTNNGT